MITYLGKLFLLLGALSGLFLSSGCINLEPTKDTTALYKLGSRGPTETAFERSVDRPSLFVMRPELPEYLASQYLYFMGPGGEMRPMPGARWGESLETGIARSLADAIRGSKQVNAVGMYPWPVAKESDRLFIRVYQLDAMHDGFYHSSIDWELHYADGARQSGQVVSEAFTWNPGDPKSYVETTNRILEDLMDQILEETYSQ